MIRRDKTSEDDSGHLEEGKLHLRGNRRWKKRVEERSGRSKEDWECLQDQFLHLVLNPYSVTLSPSSS